MKRLLFALGVLAFFAASALGQSPSPAGDGQSARHKLSVDKLFERWDKPGSPGCALAIIRDGKIAYERGYGMADLDHDVPITPASVFHVASVSKQFTAAAIALLAQQGKLSLDDEVRKHVPELPDFGTPITIRHLVHHTSGLRDQWSLLGLAGWRYSLDLITDDDVLEMIARQKDLNFRPGEKHMYSNTGYTLMAQIVKRVSGRTFREFTGDSFFRPLGMTRTNFRDDHAAIVKDQAYGYVPAGATFRLSITNFDTVGATSLLTTVRDLARWDQNFYDQKVGGAALIEKLHQRGRLNSGEEIAYAFGLLIGKYKGLPIVEHSGGDAGYRAHLMRFPEQRFSVACLCNTNARPSELARKIADIYLADNNLKDSPAATAPEIVKLTDTQLAQKVGAYLNRESGATRRVSLKDGKLFLMYAPEGGEELRPIGENRFSFGPQGIAEIRFEAGTKGGPLRLAESFGGQPEFFEWVEAWTPTGRELNEFAGTYSSDEIEALYRVALSDGVLVLKRLRSRPVNLVPFTRDVFTTTIGAIRITRDISGRVSGAVLNSGSIRNFRLSRQSGP